MDVRTRKLLHACDEKSFEHPAHFKKKIRDDLETRARAVYECVTELCGEAEFEDWNYNQDASFGLEILLTKFQTLSSRPTFAAPDVICPVIRFSNFGNLATITLLEMMPEKFVASCIRSLEAHGFHYVPAEQLHCEYDGVMQGHERLRTWWTRYFDWL